MQAANHKDPADTGPEQVAIRCVLMRGGTSKALFFHESDVPPAGPARDRMLKRVMGTPDVMQIDGLGGSRLVTSKVAIIQRSKRADADVEYTFGQVDVETDLISYEGNCGNISSAVGPFAIDEGLVDAVSPVTTVRIYNTNTEKMLVAKVPVAGGKARVTGNCAVAGVPGTGAEILMDYSGTVGAKTGHLLPTGNPTDFIRLENATSVEVTICDAANPCVFVAAKDLGLSGSELAPVISADQKIIKAICEIQAKAGELIGLWSDWKSKPLPGLPLLVLVAPPADYTDMQGNGQFAASMDLRARLVFHGKCHESMAGTGSMCTAAASRVRSSVLNKALGASPLEAEALRIGHPLGVMEVKVVIEPDPQGQQPQFRALGFARTARRLMDGVVYVPNDSYRNFN